MTQLRKIRLLLYVLIVIAVAAFLVPQWLPFWMSMNAEPRAVTARGDLAASEKNNIAIFSNASPSVVYITSLDRRVNFWTRDVTQIPRGTGSGFIWDGLGHIVTNYHVIEDASSVHIRLHDQRTYKAEFVGASPDHDLAVLRMPGIMNMPQALPIGTSSDLQVGQIMYAIGNPFGLDYTLTTGVVSALNRSLDNDNGSRIKGLIQTDAAINPGNSGGPLLDSAGRLVGINTAIYSPSGAYAGIGFAVPIDTVNRIVPELIANGRYQRPQLGITIDENLNQLITENFGVKGVAVIDTESGSVADSAGLRGVQFIDGEGILPGDIILALGEHSVDSSESLLDALEKFRKGDQLVIKYLRDRREQRVSVTLR